MMMRIFVSHSQEFKEGDAPADDSSSRVIESLLSAVTSLTLPIAAIDKLLSILDDEKLYWAIKMGDSACTVAEAATADDTVATAIDMGINAATKLREIRQLIEQVEAYKQAAIQAGAH